MTPEENAREQEEIKNRIRTAQVRAALASNAGMLQLYWEIGSMLVQRQKQAGWGAGVLRRLAADLHNDVAEVKDFSERNLKLMTQFFREYPDFLAIGNRPLPNWTPPPMQKGKGNGPLPYYSGRTTSS